MVNLNKCKFGDRLKIRDGRIAVFLDESIAFVGCFVCVIEAKEGNLTMFYRKNGKCLYSTFDCNYDIIGKLENDDWSYKC